MFQGPSVRGEKKEEMADISIDALIQATLEHQSRVAEPNNNNNNNSDHKAPKLERGYPPQIELPRSEPVRDDVPLVRSPAVASPKDQRYPPQIELPREEPANPLNDVPSPSSKRPFVPIVHHQQTPPAKPPPSTSRADVEREELERRLALQRAKKYEEAEAVATAAAALPAPPPPLPPVKAASPPPPPLKSPPPPPPKKTSVSALGLPVPQTLSHVQPPPPTTPPVYTRPSMPASIASSTSLSSNDKNELAAKLARRAQINEGEEVAPSAGPKLGLYAEFPEFSRKQIKQFLETFKKFDEDQDNFIDFMELKRMMEKLGEAQTHIALKDIIRKVDEDKDGKVSMREFLLIFRLAAKGAFECSAIFNELAASIDVAKEGVPAAANFFEAKIAQLTQTNKFEQEIRQEQEERKAAEAEKKERREKFLASKNLFH